MSLSSSTKSASTDSGLFAISEKDRIPRERYYDRAFFESEKENLWKKTWQLACRLQEIPYPNDFVEYEICDQSILIVRQANSSVKAYFNVCPHRATQLAKGEGHFQGGQISCPFHGWRWDVNGDSSFIYGKEGFDTNLLKPCDIDLRTCKAEIWGDSVWINLDPNAAPLSDHLNPVADKLEALGIGNWKVKWWQETILDSNWKMAQEAFMEGWHVMMTHPQLTLGAGESMPADYLHHQAYPNGHGSFQFADVETDFFNFDTMLASAELLVNGLDAMVIDRDVKMLEGIRNKISAKDSVRQAVVNAFRDYYGGAGIPMPEGVENNPMWWSSMIFVFPNTLYLPMYGNCLAYRIRPHNDNPEQCRFEVWSLTSCPESSHVARATSRGRFPKDDDRNWPLIPIQDFGNIERQQRGLRSIGFAAHRLSAKWESAIFNMHQHLDSYIYK